VSEPLLHLVFSASSLAVLPSRVGEDDCVVLMPGSHAAEYELHWPPEVRVFCIRTPDEFPPRHGQMIDYRQLVILTETSSRVISW